jgi:heat shock protein HslJ
MLCYLAKSQPLSGSKWVLSSIDDLETGISKEIGKLTKATLQFDSDTSYSGKFCATYSGHFRHNKETAIKIGIPSYTRMSCLGIDKYEKEVFALLPLTFKYRVDKGVLYLFTTDRKRLSFSSSDGKLSK